MAAVVVAVVAAAFVAETFVGLRVVVEAPFAVAVVDATVAAVDAVAAVAAARSRRTC